MAKRSLPGISFQSGGSLQHTTRGATHGINASLNPTSSNLRTSNPGDFTSAERLCAPFDILGKGISSGSPTAIVRNYIAFIGQNRLLFRQNDLWVQTKPTGLHDLHELVQGDKLLHRRGTVHLCLFNVSHRQESCWRFPKKFKSAVVPSAIAACLKWANLLYCSNGSHEKG